MELHPTADQELFRDTTARFIVETAPIAEVRRLADTERGYDADWWRRATELGWTSLLAPEDLGGGGVSDNPLVDLALVAFERGRVVSPGPFLPVNAVLGALAASADRPSESDALAGGLMSGETIATFALDERGGAGTASALATTVSAAGDGHVVTGVKTPVEAAVESTAFVVAGVLDGEPALVLVDAGAQGVTVTPRQAVDLVRRFATLHLEDAPATVLVTGEQTVQHVIDIAAVLQLAETVGASDRVLEFTVEWAFDRTSFGRSLASYQELKHRFADMRTWLEASKATTMAAARAVGAGDPDATTLTSAAKAYVGQHAPELVQDCVQLHGGIGVTWEHDIHLYLRRVMLNTATLGSVTDHRRRLGARAVAAG